MRSRLARWERPATWKGGNAAGAAASAWVPEEKTRRTADLAVPENDATTTRTLIILSVYMLGEQEVSGEIFVINSTVCFGNLKPVIRCDS